MPGVGLEIDCECFIRFKWLAGLATALMRAGTNALDTA